MGAALAVCLTFATTSYAKTTQRDIDEAKDEINDLKEQKEEAEDEAESITDRKAGLEAELGSLNGQLGAIVSSINELEIKIAAKEAEIETAAAALTAAEEQARQQYEDMKLRIQFMYENGMTSLWQTLFTAESFTDFLNRTEYIASINEYDRAKMEEYRQLAEEIAENKKKLEEDRGALVAMQEKKQARQKEVNSLIDRTKNSLAAAEDELARAWSDVDELDEKLREMIAYEKELEIRKAKEDAARLAAIREQEKEDTSGVVYVPQGSDEYLLGAIIQCESDGEPYAGKLAVGSVVINRVKSSYFPNTISGVIYQSGQFSPVASGRLAHRIEAGVNATCLQAAREVLGGNITTSCLYFRTNNGIIQGTVIGNHVFY